MKKFTNLFLSVCAVALLAGCSGKDGDPGPTGPAGPAGPSGQNLTGNLFGFINPVDENGAVQNRAGVTVSLDNVTPAQTATSDANGRFEFQNLRSGTYNLTFSRNGYASFRRIAFGHVGGDQPSFLGTTSITQPSSLLVNNFSFGTPTATTIPYSLNLTNTNPNNSTFRVAFFASTTPDVTATNGTALGTFIYSAPGLTNSSFSKTTFTNAGFAAGTRVYVIGYAAPAINPAYVDPSTGRAVSTGFNPVPSSVQSTVIP